MRKTSGTLALVLAGAVTASAGEPATLGVGLRVRVQLVPGMTDTLLLGRVAATDADTLTLAQDLGGMRKVAWSDVRRVEVSRGRRSVESGLVRGAGVGILCGAVGGLVYGAAQGNTEYFSSEDNAAMGAMVFGTLGAGIGAAVGVATRGERWQATEARGVRVSARPALVRRGAGVSVAVSF